MIEEYANNLADQIGIELSQVSIIDGKLLGCRDSHLLQLYAGGQTESVLIYQLDLDDLQRGISRGTLETRLTAALTRLQQTLKSSKTGDR